MTSAVVLMWVRLEPAASGVLSCMQLLDIRRCDH